MKLFRLLFLFITSLFIVSCEEDFNPYGDYVEKYAFTCILKSDMSFQTATLLKSYRPDGFDPYSYTEDPSVIGADIRIWYNDSVFVFNDSSVARTDTSRYNTPFSFYYSSAFNVKPRKTIEVEILLPNGKRLHSSSATPGDIIYNDQSDVIIPVGGKNIIQLIWNNIDDGTFFSPRMAIRYKQNINGEIVEKEKDIPVEYIPEGNDFVPVYPAPGSYTTIIYNLDAIEKAMQEISEGDPDKQNYSIYQKVLFKLTAFDSPSSRYLSSTGGTIDDLTVSVDVSDYTNIEGGFGLFGSYSRKNYTKLRFLESFITSFGYNFIIEN
ncbi:MAG: hypothetical protein ACHQLA_07520 [Ignavibacteriales bacterium]